MTSRQQTIASCNTVDIHNNYYAGRVMHRSGVLNSDGLSVCDSVPSVFPTLIGRAAHNQRESPGGSTRGGQRTFSS